MSAPELGAFDSFAHNDAVLELSRRDLFIAVHVVFGEMFFGKMCRFGWVKN